VHGALLSVAERMRRPVMLIEMGASRAQGQGQDS
jgi:hypothetical protein